MDGRATDSTSDPHAVLRQLIRQAQAETPSATVASPQPPDDDDDDHQDSISGHNGGDHAESSSGSSAGSTDGEKPHEREEASSSPPLPSIDGSTHLLSDGQISATLASIAADRQELTTLLQHKGHLSHAQKRNVKHQRSLQRALEFIAKTREQLKSALGSLDVADLVDAEDQSLEVIRAHKLAEDEAATCPFPASMVQQIPLLRLQSIERAEYDKALGVKLWLDTEDQQLRIAVKGAAMKVRTIQLSNDPTFRGDALAEAANMDEQTALRFAEEIEANSHDYSEPSTSFKGKMASKGLDWATIAARVPTRSMEEVKTRWYGLLRPSLNTASWGDQELDDLIRLATPYLSASLSHSRDNQLRYAAKEPMPSASTSAQTALPCPAIVPWQTIARQLGTGRTAHACFVAYCTALVQRDQPDPTPAEDDNIKQLFSLFRGAWRFIALHSSASPNISLTSLLPTAPSASDKMSPKDRPSTLLGTVGRDPQGIYRRFRNALDPAMATGTWSPFEDASLLKAVRQVGEDNWAAVAARMFGRNSSQCRERWNRRLKQVVADAGLDALGEDEEMDAQRIADLIDRKKKVAWTKEMDELLLDCLDDEFKGRNGRTFVSIAKHVADKTGMSLSDKSVRDRVVSLRRERVKLRSARSSDGTGGKGKRRESEEEKTDDPTTGSLLSGGETAAANHLVVSEEPSKGLHETETASPPPKARPRTAIVPGAKRQKL